jgi:UDP-N-acetylmuramate: L-alanyl-gamma-D-glutamyl-meso-diaminopimelate ligase
MGDIKSIHLIAACGTGMGTLACILKKMGYRVTGSDSNVYPPMSDFLENNGIPLFQGFDAAHLDYGPDLVIVGNAVTKKNPESVALLDSGIPFLSMPQAVNRFVAKDKKIILVTGTHGKTTTSAIMSHILFTAGLDPSFMIGGIVKDYDSSFRIGNGDYMVIEGDEYDTAFFDKGPKFMHYDPAITIMTGIEFDHADIFKDIGQIKDIFSGFVDKIKDNSHIIAFSGNENLNQVLSGFNLSLQTYGEGAQWSFSNHSQQDGRSIFDVSGPQSRFTVNTLLPGQHNLFNMLACIAAAIGIGIRVDTIQKALETFSGVKRRQEIRGVKKQITVMDDFAHHPTAVRETIRAVKPYYRQGRVIAVFEPRTNTSMRTFFQQDYPISFQDADMAYICEPAVKKNIPAEEKFDVAKLADDIRALGMQAFYFADTTALLDHLVPQLKPNDLVLIMSNGGFDNIHERLLERIS